MSKTRWKYEKNEHGIWCFDVCYDYPNCNHEAHFVYEKNRKKKGKSAGGEHD